MPDEKLMRGRHRPAASSTGPEILVCGAINWDTTIFLDRFPRKGEEIKVRNIISVPGGKGANIATAAARLLRRKNSVAILGALGSDQIAYNQIKFLKKDGVDTSLVLQNSTIPSGQAYILVDNKGANVVLTFKKANNFLTQEKVSNESVKRAIRKSAIVAIVDPPLSVASKLIRLASFYKKTVVWVPGLLSYSGLTRLKNILREVDFLVLNESESVNLTGLHNPVEAATSILAKSGKNNLRIIITLGKKGCIVAAKEELVSTRKPTYRTGVGYAASIALIPTINLKSLGLTARNSAGAGDAFVGTLCAMKIRGLSDIEALKMANTGGSLKTTRLETRSNVTLKELNSALLQQELSVRKIT